MALFGNVFISDVAPFLVDVLAIVLNSIYVRKTSDYNVVSKELQLF